MTVTFAVDYTYYQYNSGAADNGCYRRNWPVNDAVEAVALAGKINAAAKAHQAYSHGTDTETPADEYIREQLENEMIPYMGYFISARALKITSEPIEL
jgi:hypothetical protein